MSAFRHFDQAYLSWPKRQEMKFCKSVTFFIVLFHFVLETKVYLKASDGVPHLKASEGVPHLKASDGVPHLKASNGVPHLKASNGVLEGK